MMSETSVESRRLLSRGLGEMPPKQGIGEAVEKAGRGRWRFSSFWWLGDGLLAVHCAGIGAGDVPAPGGQHWPGARGCPGAPGAADIRDAAGGKCRQDRQSDPFRKSRGHQLRRVSRSIIVNLGRVKAIQSASGGERVLILEDGRQLLMTRGMREAHERLQYIRADA